MTTRETAIFEQQLGFSVRALKPFGIEIDLDLRQPLSTEQQHNLRELSLRHQLLVLRQQHLSIEQQAEIMGCFGKVLHANGEYRTISSDGNLGAKALGFHSDLSFTEYPFKAISLHATDVIDEQTCTLFASGIRALQQIPQTLRMQLDGSKALAVISIHQSERNVPYNPPSMLPQVERTAIIRHPETGADILYISELQTARIGDLAQAQSEALIQRLFGYLYSEQNIYEHRWRNGDLVMWDNLALQHARPDLTGCVPRTLQRIVVAEKTFFELCPQFNLDDPRIARWAAGEPLAL